MHNWRFLLLAFVAVFQPIASYSERGLVDGRQQRCDYRTASALREPGLYFHGTHRFSKPAVEDRRLNQRADVREIRRNEVREESLTTTSSPDRRLVDAIERGVSTPSRLGRFSQIEARLARDGVVLRQENLGAQLRDYRKERNQEFRAERPSSIYGSRRTRLDSRQSNSRLSEDENRFGNRRSMELRRDTSGNRDNSPTIQRAQEIRETRIVTDRTTNDLTKSAQADRRVARERAQRTDTKRFESRRQNNRNVNHDILDQRSRSEELRRSSVSTARVYRAYNNEEACMATRATQSLDRDERRSAQSRQSVDEQTQKRDIHRNRVTINRNRVSTAQRNIRQAFDRTRKTTNLQSDRSTESRRDVSRTDIRSLRRDRSVENRNENQHEERETTRTNEIRLINDRVSQNSRRDSQILERERAVENRRDGRDIQRMERNSRSVERVAETRRDARSADRARISNNRQEIRNIGKESRTMLMDRTGINKRDVRTFVSDLERSTDVRRETPKNNRDSCSLTRERLTDRQLANRDYRRVAMARASSAGYSLENNRNTRNVLSDSRIAGFERATDNRRDTRNFESKSREPERERIAARNIRLNFRDVRSIENERSQASRRDNRNTVSRTVRIEGNRREARNVEERARSTDRVANHRRDTRENERDVRNIGLDRFSEARDRRTQRDSRARAASSESRRDVRNVERRTIEDERIIAHRRAARSSVERNARSVRGERLSESLREVRKADRDSRIFASERLAENRRERASENRKEIRSTEKDARTIQTEQARRVQSKIINTARSRDTVSMDRRNYRVTERLNKRDTQLDRRSRSVQRETRVESQRSFERNNEELERREAETLTKKREFLSMTRNSSQDKTEGPAMNWQYVFYTLQGLYICGVLTQLMNERNAVKKSRFSWWFSPQHLIKVD